MVSLVGFKLVQRSTGPIYHNMVSVITETFSLVSVVLRPPSLSSPSIHFFSPAEMGKLLCDAAVAELPRPTQPPALLTWTSPEPSPPAEIEISSTVWDSVPGLEEQQRRHLNKIHSRGVLWRNTSVCSPANSSSSISSVVAAAAFRLEHGGGVDADGNCLFTAARRAAAAWCAAVKARELRQRTVRRFLDDYNGMDLIGREGVDRVIRNLYSPNLKAGWGIHVLQEVKLLAKKTDREELDKGIQELVDLGMIRDAAAESIYKERCLPVSDGLSWAKYMSISGSQEDEYDIINLQYVEEGLLTVDENRGGHAAAFGDDIAIESLATELKREVYVVQAHGSDGMIDDEHCVFFLPHRPRGPICEPPIFLFMKGTGWCGAGADHYEPLVANPIPLISQEKAAVVL